MSRRIAAILGEPEHHVAKLLKELEDKNGYPSHDARFLAENIQNARLKISELGLDPDDTTSQELYHALLVRFQKHSRLFDIHFGTEEADFESKSAVAADLINKNFELPRQWSMKKPASKRILRELPPKHVMKHLGYRSVASMLKHEKPGELYLAAQYLETASWQKAHSRLVSKLDQTDFELRQLRIIQLDSRRWSDVAGPQEAAARNYDTGSIALWPSGELNKAPLLSITLALFEELELENVSISKSMAKLSGVLEWWADMDHLIAELGGEHVSFSLKDCALNSLEQKAFEERGLEHVRRSFWGELLSRYENRPPAEALFDRSVREKIAGLRFNVPEVAYEFAEDFDG